MLVRKEVGNQNPEGLGGLLEAMLRRSSAIAEPDDEDPLPAPSPDDTSGRYDFDLAEFPLFRFYRTPAKNRDPLAYTDTITGHDGKPVAREWKAYPGPFGFGGASTQTLLYDLLQLYVEQGARGSQIQFGTLRSLFLRRGERNPSKRDYDRMRRDLDILRGYDFHCKNAFWDRERAAYADMNWRLFGAVFYFQERPGSGQEQLPFGFIEVSSVLRQIARTRGFFALGFPNDLFYRMKPLEQRLAVYLAKKFTSQKLHRRYLDDLAAALPVEAARPRDAKAIIKAAADGLLGHRLPILAGFGFEAATGRTVITFERKARPAGAARVNHFRPAPLSEAEAAAVGRITAAVGSAEDRPWWGQCVRRLGIACADHALGLLKETRDRQSVPNPGGLLTKMFKDVAAERGVGLR